MALLILLIIIVLCLGPIGFLVAIGMAGRVRRLEEALERLEKTSRLENTRTTTAPHTVAETPPVSLAIPDRDLLVMPPSEGPLVPESPPVGAVDMPAPHAADFARQPDTSDGGVTDRLTAVPPPDPLITALRDGSYERHVGSRGFVWIGAAALVFAGFFFVKYWVDAGFLTASVRVSLGLIFGTALIVGGQALHKRPDIANSARIAQGLIGAGIADFYACLFAATNLYHLVPDWLGFVGMTLVTVLALILSLRHGPAIAALGLIGGYGTPLMVGGDPNAPLLFSYLFVIFSGLALIVRRQGWWWLAIGSLAFGFLWVGAWLRGGAPAGDAPWLLLFLFGMAATQAIVTRFQGVVTGTGFGTTGGTPIASPHHLSRFVSVGGALIMATLVSLQFPVDFLTLGLFALLAGGAIVLAVEQGAVYGFAPWFALGANLLTLATHDTIDRTTRLGAILGFAGLFAVCGHRLARRTDRHASWSGLLAASITLYYLLAYFTLDLTVIAALKPTDILSPSLFWALIALVFSAFFTRETVLAITRPLSKRDREILQAIFAATATGFLSIGFAILIDRHILAVAFAAQILGLAWINGRAAIPALRPIAMALMVPFALICVEGAISPDGFALFPAIPVIGTPGMVFDTLGTILAPIAIRFALPAGMIALASWFFRTSRDDGFVTFLEQTTVGLILVTIYALIDRLLPDHDFLGRGLFTDFTLAGTVATLWVARRHGRPALVMTGIVLGCGGLVRLVGLDLLLHDPLWTKTAVGAVPIINGLAVNYGLPLVIARFGIRELTATKDPRAARSVAILALALGFILVTLTVRQYFQGTFLNHPDVESGEIYAYSVAWLLLGIGLLLAGVQGRNRDLRAASLAITALTITKVFLYDASILTGLWRVASFFILGLCLLGLSWFYTAFVGRAPDRGT